MFNKKLSYIILIGTIVCGCLVFFACHIFANNSPCISIENPVINLGNVDPEEGDKEASFVIKNTGRSPLQLTRLIVSCSCVKTQLGSSLIQPGEETSLNVTFYPPYKNGEWRDHIVIESNDPKNKMTKLILKSYLEFRCQVQPDTLVIDNLQENEIRSAEIAVLGPSSDLSFKILDATSENKSISISRVSEEGTIKGRNRKKYLIGLAIKSNNLDSWQDQVTISTTDDEKSVIQVPVTVHEAKKINYEPRMLSLRHNQNEYDHNGSFIKITSLRKDLLLKCDRIETTEWLKVRESKEKSNAKTLFLEVTLVKPLQKGLIKGVVKIHMKNITEPVKIPVFVFSQEEKD